MYFQQSDLFGGLSEGFVKEFTDIGKKETYETGDILFQEGDPPGYFFVLLEGSIKISIGETGHTVSSVDEPGEVFGWSSLVGRDKYSASAECREETTLLRMDVERLNRLLEINAGAGMIFFKRLAGVLGNRLLQTYKLMSDTAETDISRSYGTGQVLESDMKVS